MNLFENVGNIVGLLWWATSRSPRAFILLMLSVTATFCKTVLYMLHEHCSPEHSHPTAHNFPDNVQNYLLLYILPNSLWVSRSTPESRSGGGMAADLRSCG